MKSGWKWLLLVCFNFSLLLSLKIELVSFIIHLIICQMCHFLVAVVLDWIGVELFFSLHSYHFSNVHFTYLVSCLDVIVVICWRIKKKSRKRERETSRKSFLSSFKLLLSSLCDGQLLLKDMTMATK